MLPLSLSTLHGCRGLFGTGGEMGAESDGRINLHRVGLKNRFKLKLEKGETRSWAAPPFPQILPTTG